MLRLFVAVDLPAQLRDDVTQMMDGVHNARWVSVRQLHITLRFLGDTSETDLPGIEKRLGDLKRDSFHLRLRGAGTFPETGARKSRKPPKVLWLGIEPATELAGLKRAIDDALAVDLTREKQIFSAHLTLARFPNPPDHTLSDFLSRHKNYASPDWPVKHFHLYQSTLRPEGAIHAQLASYPLTQPERKE
jgi:RNA 2',3'-cyclic 3'-phosphodiesterase